MSKYLPAFFLTNVFPVLLSLLISQENMDYIYDLFLFLYIDNYLYMAIIQVARAGISFFRIYLSIALLFVPCILIERRNISGFSAVDESFRLARGRKSDLFFLCLSFAGWFLLGYTAFIIGILWAIVYFNATLYIYYKRLIRAGMGEIVENIEEIIAGYKKSIIKDIDKTEETGGNEDGSN